LDCLHAGPSTLGQPGAGFKRERLDGETSGWRVVMVPCQTSRSKRLIIAAEGTTEMADSIVSDSATPRQAVATLAGGCFWCIEAVFLEVDGVTQVEPGYSNGHAPNPTYRDVCSGDTGHAEVVRLVYDPDRISYRELLEIFFVVHDPTTPNRQGNDVGTQYRSGIYTHDDEQVAIAKEVVAELAAQGIRAVTEIEPVRNYHVAEPYHHRYFEQHPNEGYCAFVVAPKVAKFRKTFAARRKPA
jgi:peptide-methionine (S)-S-oxide reductase